MDRNKKAMSSTDNSDLAWIENALDAIDQARHTTGTAKKEAMERLQETLKRGESKLENQVEAFENAESQNNALAGSLVSRIEAEGGRLIASSGGLISDVGNGSGVDNTSSFSGEWHEGLRELSPKAESTMTSIVHYLGEKGIQAKEWDIGESKLKGQTESRLKEQMDINAKKVEYIGKTAELDKYGISVPIKLQGDKETEILIRAEYMPEDPKGTVVYIPGDNTTCILMYGANGEDYYNDKTDAGGRVLAKCKEADYALFSVIVGDDYDYNSSDKGKATRQAIATGVESSNIMIDTLTAVGEGIKAANPGIEVSLEAHSSGTIALNEAHYVPSALDDDARKKREGKIFKLDKTYDKIVGVDVNRKKCEDGGLYTTQAKKGNGYFVVDPEKYTYVYGTNGSVAQNYEWPSKITKKFTPDGNVVDMGKKEVKVVSISKETHHDDNKIQHGHAAATAFELVIK